MNKAEKLLASIPVEEAKYNQNEVYRILRQMVKTEKIEWDAFMTDIQNAMGAEGEKLIPTMILDKIMKRATRPKE